MQLTTPHGLVLSRLGETTLTHKRLRRALRSASFDGWVWGYVPSHREPDRILPLVRRDAFLAPLLGLTGEAAATGGSGVAVVPRRMVQAELNMVIEDPYAGRVLGNHGLVIQDVFGDEIQLVGAAPQMARIVNELRYPQERRRRRLASILVQAARGTRQQPRRISIDARIETHDAFMRFDVNADEILDGRDKVRLTSAWELRDLPGLHAIVGRIVPSAVSVVGGTDVDH